MTCLLCKNEISSASKLFQVGTTDSVVSCSFQAYLVSGIFCECKHPIQSSQIRIHSRQAPDKSGYVDTNLKGLPTTQTSLLKYQQQCYQLLGVTGIETMVLVVTTLPCQIRPIW